MEKTNIGMIKAAYADDIIESDFDLGSGIVGSLSLSDMNDIIQEQARIEEIKRSEYMEKYGETPINETKWDAYIATIEDPDNKKRINDKKPANLAEQFADADTRLIIMTELLPKRIRKKGTMELLFPEEKDQKEFGRLIIDAPKLGQKVQNVILEMMSKVPKVRDKAKNLSKPAS